MSGSWFDRIPQDAHWLIVGGTRRGKSGLLELVTRACIRRGLDGLTAIDPHGAYVRGILEWLANPRHGQHRREVILLDPSSTTTFGLNCLAVADTSWESCHLAANTLTSIVESRFEASPEQTPRLARIIYVAAMFCARRQLTLIELLEVLSLGGEELRQSLLSEFDNFIVRRELEELHQLAARHPARFLEVVESAKNRFVRWLGDPRLARILGQRRGLDPRTIMDSRTIVLADFSSLNYADAAFLGCILSSMYFSAARFRPPLRCARHRLIMDEAESLLTVDVARMCDQSAKVGLNLIAAVQRLGQLRARGDFLADALMTNCTVQTVFGGLEPESCRYVAERFFAGFIDLCEWKRGSERPVAVGSHKETVKNCSTAHHSASHEAVSETESIARGTARTHMVSVTEADGESATDATSEASALGTMQSEAFGSAASSFDGTSSSASMDPMTGGIFMPPTITSLGSSASIGAGLTDMASRSSGSSASTISGSAHARSTSHMTAVTEALGVTRSEVRGYATSRMHGSSRGVSESAGEGETFVTTYEWLPSATYSLEEQLHRLAGEIANLPRRECFVKIEDQRPFRTRTADLAPPFRSPYFKTHMLPVFLKAGVARSPFLLPASAADTAIAARRRELITPLPEPDLKPEPMPILDDPVAFAERFVAKREDDDKAKPPTKPKRPLGRRPTGDLGPEHDRFRVIDGDGDRRK